MSEQAPPSRTGNRLLDRLLPEEPGRLFPLVETVSLRHLEQLHEQDGPTPYVYFPKSGVLSSVISLGEGRVVEAATVGNEGMIGIPALLGLDFAAATATAQVPVGLHVSPVLVECLHQRVDTGLLRRDGLDHRGPPQSRLGAVAERIPGTDRLERDSRTRRRASRRPAVAAVTGRSVRSPIHATAASRARPTRISSSGRAYPRRLRRFAGGGRTIVSDPSVPPRSSARQA